MFKDLECGDLFTLQDSSGTSKFLKLEHGARIYGHRRKDIYFNSINCDTGIMFFVEDEKQVHKEKKHESDFR